MTAQLSQLGIYSAFIRNAFLEMLTYRLRYFIGIATYLLFVSVHYFIWSAVYYGRPEGAEIKGFSLEDMITYIAVGWIARSFYHSDIDYDMEEDVRTGNISIFLLRPVNFQLMTFSKAMGGSLFRFFFFSTPVGLVIVWLFPVMLPKSSFDFLFFFLATILGFFILAAINFLVGLLAFSFKAIDSIIRAKYFFIQLFSGLLLPIPFFPDWLRVVLDVLPFKAIAYVPLQFYLGKVPQDEILGVFFSQLAWLIVLVFLGQYFWQRALGKLTLQGG